MKNKLAKWKPYIFLAFLLTSLVPLGCHTGFLNRKKEN